MHWNSYDKVNIFIPCMGCLASASWHTCTVTVKVKYVSAHQVLEIMLIWAVITNFEAALFAFMDYWLLAGLALIGNARVCLTQSNFKKRNRSYTNKYLPQCCSVHVRVPLCCHAMELVNFFHHSFPFLILLH